MFSELPSSPAYSGIEFLDRQIADVPDQGIVIGLLGSTGTGKSKLARMIAAEGALREAKLRSTQPRRKWVFVCSETSAAEIYNQMLLHLGALSIDQVERHVAADPWQLVPATDASPVSRNTFLQTALTQGSLVLPLANFPFRDWGDPAEQIHAYLASKLGTATGIAGVIFDDVDSIVDEYRRSGNQPVTAQSRLLRTFLENSRQMAQTLACPVWVTHNLRGSVGRATHTAILTHRDAAGCRDFGEHLDGCFVLGNHDPRTGYFLVQCTKLPRSQKTAPAVVRIARNGATVEEVFGKKSEEFFNRPRRKKAVDVDEDALDFLRELAAKQQHPTRDDDLANRVVQAVFCRPRSESL
ncbi:MAG: hypothetical protein H6822_24095 [Planctomycetaceae bacterium]|nr:hypothetical protein [Planctomycetales bacterium]MCB9925281.1 hypothetical protein [Planctomycetaceae bacterium]